MGDMWRSQKMTLVQMIVQNDAAHAVVNKLGQVGIVEFRDVSPPHWRPRSLAATHTPVCPDHTARRSCAINSFERGPVRVCVCS